MTRTQLKVFVTMWVVDNIGMKKVPPLFLDRWVDSVHGQTFRDDDDIIDQFKLALCPPKPRPPRKPRRERTHRAPQPRMTKALIRECVGAGEDWWADLPQSWRDETDGQSEAMDIGAGLAPHPSLAMACAEYVYEGVCKARGQ